MNGLLIQKAQTLEGVSKCGHLDNVAASGAEQVTAVAATR